MLRRLTGPWKALILKSVMQLSFKKQRNPSVAGRKRLADLREGEAGVIEQMDLPTDVALRLMELGFVPGNSVAAARSAPGGDPRVFRVDGTDIALRVDTASKLILQR